MSRIGSGQKIRLVFTGDSSIISPARVGEDLVFSASITAFDPPTPDDTVIRQYSRRYGRKASTLVGGVVRGSIVFDRITGDRLSLLDEFIESVRGERLFTIEAGHISGISRDIEAFSSDNAFPRDRVSELDEYTFTLNYEALDDTGHTSTDAIVLAFGTVSAETRTSTPVNPVRFASIYFPESDINRTLVMRLTGSNLRVTCNGHRVLEHANGTQNYSFDLRTEYFMDGMNALRIESHDTTIPWSVSNVRVS